MQLSLKAPLLVLGAKVQELEVKIIRPRFYITNYKLTK